MVNMTNSIGMQEGRQTDRLSDIQVDRKIEIQRDIEAGRQKNRKIVGFRSGRQANGKHDVEREREFGHDNFFFSRALISERENVRNETGVHDYGTLTLHHRHLRMRGG